MVISTYYSAACSNNRKREQVSACENKAAAYVMPRLASEAISRTILIGQLASLLERLQEFN